MIPQDYNDNLPIKRGFRKYDEKDTNWLFFNNDAKGGIKVVPTLAALYDLPCAFHTVGLSAALVTNAGSPELYVLGSLPVGYTAETKTVAGNWIPFTVLQGFTGGISYIDNFDPNGYDGTTNPIKDSAGGNAGTFYIVINAPSGSEVSIDDDALFAGDPTTLSNNDWVIFDGIRYRLIQQAESAQLDYNALDNIPTAFTPSAHTHDGTQVTVVNGAAATVTLQDYIQTLVKTADVISTVTNAVSEAGKLITLGLTEARYLKVANLLATLDALPTAGKTVDAVLIFNMNATLQGKTTLAEALQAVVDAGYTTYSTSDFNTDFGNKTTDDLTEGASNFYITTAEKNKVALIPNDVANPAEGELITRSWGVENIGALAKYLNTNVISINGLKGIVSTSLPTNNYILFANTDDSDVLYAYRLLAGTDVEALPTVVRPTDYAATTNEKVWKRVTIQSQGDGVTLGELATDAYRGDRGKIAYDHSQLTHDKAFVGLANVDNTSDALKPVSNAVSALVGLLSNLSTTSKADIVSAINELYSAIQGVGNLSNTDIDTLAELNAILTDAAILTQAQIQALIDASTAIDNTNLKVLTTTTPQTLWEETDEVLLNARTTGIRFGGRITVDGGLGNSALVSFTRGAGQILNNTDAENPTYILITFTAKLSVALISNTPNITYFYYDDNSDVLKQTTVIPTVETRKTRLYIARTSFTGGVISGISPEVTLIQQEGAAIRELSSALGEVKLQGLQPVFSGANLKLKVTSGTVYDYNVNYEVSYVNTNQKTFSTFDSALPENFRHVTSSGTIPIDRTDLRVGFYQVGGVETAIPNPAGTVGIHFVWRFGASGNTRVSYGLATYSSIADGVAALGSVDPYLTVPANYEQALLLGAVIATKATTDLQAEATFVSTNKFGLFGGGLFTAGGSFLEIANNLSEVDPTISRTNLEVYSTVEVDGLVSIAVDAAYTNLGATPSFDLSTADVFKRTMNVNVTELTFTNGVEGKVYILRIKVDATGGYTFAYTDTDIRTQDDIPLIMPSTALAEHDYYVELRDTKYKITPIYDIA
jgi:hypothetical protein